MRQPGEPEGLAGEPVRIGRPRRRDDRCDPRVRRAGEERADRAHRVAGDRPDRHLRLLDQRPEGGQRVGPEFAGAQRQLLGRVRAVAADVEGQAMEARRVEEDGHRQRPVARRFPAVDEDDAGARRSTSGGDEPGRAAAARRTR